MRVQNDSSNLDDDHKWWRLDFTTVLVLLVLGAFLMLATFELWFSHTGIH